MAKIVLHAFHLLLLILFLTTHHSDQLQPSQIFSLLQIRQLLNYPPALTVFKDSTDFCSIEPTPSFTLACYEDNITQLHMFGNNGDLPLPPNFSTDTFFEALGSLSSLKVLSLVSLGLWGPLPRSIESISSLEILNISRNYFNGDIPIQLSSLRNLQTVILDNNEFTGKVPEWLISLPVLAVLSVKNNSLGGFLPNSLTVLQNLRVLALSNNNFSGEVPDLSNLTNLQVLDLEDNYFGPHFPALPTKLVSLVLRKNKFGFGIPAELGHCYQLQKLDISLNEFVGPFLPSLLSLPSINYIDISKNKFTGMLSQNMSCNAELVLVNLSSNLLTGELPSCLHLDSKSSVVVSDKNCLSNEAQEQNPSNFCHHEALAVKIPPQQQNHTRPAAKTVLASSTAGAIVGGMAIAGVVFLVIRRANRKASVKTSPTRAITERVSPVNTAKLLSDARYISETMKLGASLPAYRTYALEELKEATKNFEASSLIGESSIGQIYKGKLSDGSLMAIRSLKMRKRHSLQTYMHRIELISRLRHCHLVSALGHCFECYQDDSSVCRIFLIFEFVPNGTLRDYISGLTGHKFTWIQRIAAAIGVVKGIQFLHTGIVPGLYSNNLKITDISFDHNLHVKIRTYNLALLAENKGTVGGGSSPGSKGR
ncbi:probable inactive leucine-rich repeat receptor-like protein kinase At3g03770 isoform X2 [Corylus avellana]|uniref:probable inactive leucine-rich repeat receptor-like protein kinase At3g03770 isoform X2 n=1 Tax=Corylus avellana TaxID=13451 RepID=UPI00286A7A4E|nr:probable inactive leucine-rich repeat receptor-like protein kinase At3g03770 isoform X2 [Corylus avellana]